VSVPRRRIRLDLAYDGTDFAGWQVQPDQRTVQGELERVLTRIHGDEPVRIRGAGRTDAGVHARGQVADFEIGTILDDADLAYTLRRMLPSDVRPVRSATVDAGFHSRKQAVGKTYRYTLDLSPNGDPFLSRFAVHWPYALDLDAVERALGHLPGRRDWSGFTAAGCTVVDRVRRLTEARLEQDVADRVTLVFSAEGFLAGRVPVETIEQVLATRDRTQAGPTAPARGLCLSRVDY